MSNKVGIFFGSSTGTTEEVAGDIHDVWVEAGMEADEPVDIGSVTDLNDLLAYDYLMIGIPTWNVGELQDDWDYVFEDLDDLDFSGKTIAMFGVGDQMNYPDNFLDAVGILGRKLQEQGATLVGYWSTEGYEHYESAGLEDDKFMGLALDDMNQADMTEERIAAWVEQVKAEFALQTT
ncbi:MAG: flavodoxin [Chloroflexota bacterium]